MARVKRGVHHVKRRRNILKKTKGYRWGRKSKLKLAKTAALKAGAYAYRDRRARKRDFRALWQMQINAALREHGMKYSTFMHQLRGLGIVLDRKILADLAAHHGPVFHRLLEIVQTAPK